MAGGDEEVRKRGGGQPNESIQPANAKGREQSGAGAQEEQVDEKTYWDQQARDLLERYLDAVENDMTPTMRAYAETANLGAMRKMVEQGTPVTNEAEYQGLKDLLIREVRRAGTAEAVTQTLERAILGRRGKPQERVKKKKKKEDDCPDRVGKGNPTQMPTGHTIHSDPVFSLDGLIPVRIESTYYGDLQSFGPLGRGRLCDLDATITRNASGGFTYRDDDTAEINFPAPTPIPDGWVDGNLERHAELMQGRHRTLLYRERGRVTTFDKCGDSVWRISRIEDRRGNALVFERDGANNIISVATPEGLKLHFDYTGENLRSQVTLEGVDGGRKPVMRYAYDPAGNMVLAECPYSERHEFEYDADNRLIRTVRNGVYEGRFAYDGQGRRTQTATNRGFPPARFAYDDENRVAIYMPSGDANRAERFFYDEKKNITREVNALGHEKRTIEHEDGLVASVIDGEGNAESYSNDGFGNIKSITDAEGRSTFYVWNSDGSLEMVIDNSGKAWEYDYDDFGALERITDPLGHITEIKNNDVGQPVGISRHDGLIQQFAYDCHHWLAEALDFRGARTRYERDGFGRVTAITDERGEITRFDYEDKSGLDFFTPSRITRPDGVATLTDSANQGRTLTTVDGEGNRTAYRYDGLNNLAGVTDPNGNRLAFHYDDELRLSKVVNQAGREWTFERDAAGRIVRETDFDAKVIAYAYDKADRVIEARHPDGRVFDYEWDKSGLLLSRSVAIPGHQEAFEETYAYDDCGRLVAASNGAATVEIEYDDAGRIVAETVNGTRVESTLDCCGNRTERRIGAHVTAYGYDPMGALTALSVDGSNVLSIDRDKAGREMRREGARGFVLEQEYDAIGQLIRQTAHRGPHRLDMGMSQRGSLPVPDTWSRQYRWNKALSPQAIADPLWGVTRYEADRNGQIVTASHGGAMQPGALPLLARAVPSGIPGFPADTQETERFSYAATLDVAGSDTTLPQQPGGRALSSWQSSAGGRVEAARGPHGETIRFSHDENGRVSERRVERNGFRPLVWRFTWDGFDRMIGVVCPDGAAWAYLYDPFGRRIEKRLLRAGENSTHAASGSGMRFVWDGHVVAAEAPLSASADGGRHADVSSAVWWHFDPGGFVPLLREDAAGGAVLHVITDHLGTPRELVDETGDLAWSASYRLWGGLRGLWTRPANDNAPLTNNGPGGMVRLASAGNAALDLYADWQDGTQTSLAPSESQQAASARLLCPIRFQGQWEDTETGLCYNRFRTYDPLSAQYMSPDPIGIEGGYRTHGYAENPRVWVDPLGLSRCDQLLEDIFNKTKLFHAEMLKYDPIADARGGFPSYRSGTLKLTVPGGHYMKLRNYQQGILKDLAAYAKEGCYKCATPNDYRKLAAASRVVSTDVKIPAGVPRIILPNGK